MPRSNYIVFYCINAEALFVKANETNYVFLINLILQWSLRNSMTPENIQNTVSVRWGGALEVYCDKGTLIWGIISEAGL